MDTKLTTLTFLSALFLLPQVASAGPLAKTGRAIGSKTSTSKSSPPRSSSSSNRDHRRDTHTRSRSSSRDNYSRRSTTYTGGYGTRCDGCTSQGRPLRLPTPEIELGLAAQKVRGSDGSVRLDARMLFFGRLGLYATGDYYFEEISQAADPKAMMDARSEHVRVNLYELAFLGRIIDTPNVQADIHAGLGVAASSLFETLPGTAVGVSLQARASKALTLRAEGRSMRLKYNTRALEGAAGIRFRELWLGYRALKFDVGQVLQGPEAGVRFKF